MTRAVFFSPIFWLAVAALATGMFIGTDSPVWAGPVACFALGMISHAIERHYVIRRARKIVLQGALDAIAMRPDLLADQPAEVIARAACPEHGDSCSAICRARARR